MIPNFALAALAAIGCPQEYPKPDAPFDEVKRFYDDSMNVESFQWRARAIDALAQTHDPRALAILKKRYSEARPGSKSAEGSAARERNKCATSWRGRSATSCTPPAARS